MVTDGLQRRHNPAARNPSLRVIGKARNIYGSALGTLEEFTLWVAARKRRMADLCPWFLRHPEPLVREWMLTDGLRCFPILVHG